MRFSRNEESRWGELPMTSMIDVVFLLLIFFMLTASAVLEAQLASALKTDEGAGRAGDLQPQIVEVIPAGSDAVFSLGQRTLTNRRELAAVLTELPKDAGVIIKVSPAVPVGSAAAALQASKDAGFRKVTYVPMR